MKMNHHSSEQELLMQDETVLGKINVLDSFQLDSIDIWMETVPRWEPETVYSYAHLGSLKQ
jgi:hypothetical protein